QPLQRLLDQVDGNLEPGQLSGQPPDRLASLRLGPAQPGPEPPGQGGGQRGQAEHHRGPDGPGRAPPGPRWPGSSRRGRSRPAGPPGPSGRARPGGRPPCAPPRPRPPPPRSAAADEPPDANACPKHRRSITAGHDPTDPPG